MGKKIYLSAAAHATDNPTKCGGKCGENVHCNAYMDMVEDRLKALGFEVKRGDAALTGVKAMRARVAEANQWEADIYYVAHTNAGGGRYSMTMYSGAEKSRALAAVIHKHRLCVKSHKIRIRKDLYEINKTKMPCLYDELFFHDSAEDCAWFHAEGMRLLAEETVKALCEICGVNYREPISTQMPAKPAIKPVQAVKKPQAGDVVKLNKEHLYVSARGSTSVIRTGTFYVYDGIQVGERYRVTNKLSRVGKAPLWANVSGWVKL